MKKITLLLVAAVMISCGVNAQSCCKKGGHCTKQCAKDKKASTKDAATNSKAVRAEAPKKTS